MWLSGDEKTYKELTNVLCNIKSLIFCMEQLQSCYTIN